LFVYFQINDLGYPVSQQIYFFKKARNYFIPRHRWSSFFFSDVVYGKKTIEAL